MLKPSVIIEQVDKPRYLADRKNLLEQEMNRRLRMLKEHGDPEKVILFGTLATGTVR